LSQAAILENQIILNAKEVTFPAKPLITVEAKVMFHFFLKNAWEIKFYLLRIKIRKN